MFPRLPLCPLDMKGFFIMKTKWLLCPVCGNKTRLQIRLKRTGDTGTGSTDGNLACTLRSVSGTVLYRVELFAGIRQCPACDHRFHVASGCLPDSAALCNERPVWRDWKYYRAHHRRYHSCSSCKCTGSSTKSSTGLLSFTMLLMKSI